ncbi:hypothetical protein KIN20_023193 [Parelaphostrongylus tenuis]|uniref:Uncharacterized protein n=1 Tax=Parelaphostrongylus tenuis TaxID=148309 RepID=A0AAD5N8S7_PARTN|nr:hypothetical protein KIN20_023193 [Parelaphostrongylus tenuis]
METNLKKITQGRESIQISKKEIRKEEVRSTDSDSSPLASSSSAIQLLSTSMSVKPSSAVLSSSLTSITDETETSQKQKGTGIDAPMVTKEDKSTSKKKKQVKKCQIEPEKPLSYLDLSNRYAVAGRKVKKHRDGNELKR